MKTRPCWSGWVVVLFGSACWACEQAAVAITSGKAPPLALYGPIVLKSDWPFWGTGRRFSYSSSSPNTSLVGTPFRSLVGSGLIHSSYQDWIPGPKPSGVSWARTEPLVGESIWFESAIRFHVLPKSLDT